MDAVVILIFIVIAVALVGAIAGSGGVRNKFARAGTLAGKTKAEIIAKVGPPTSVSALPHGGFLLQWQETGYHIALSFRADEVCLGVTHEFAN